MIELSAALVTVPIVGAVGAVHKLAEDGDTGPLPLELEPTLL